MTPLVNGTPSDPELAPVNAGVADEAVVSGAADVFSGFMTLFNVSTTSIADPEEIAYWSITCTTPFSSRISGTVTLAELAYTLPFSTVMVMFCPLTEVSVVFSKSEL